MERSKFSLAIDKALTKEYMAYFPETKKEYEFSPKFKKKMKKLISRRNKPYYIMINTAGKRAAVIIITTATAAAAIMSVEAFRTAFVDFFVHIFEKFSIIEPKNTENNAPDTIENMYEITYNLSDYSIDFEAYNDLRRNIRYVKNEITIDYFQEVKITYVKNWNTEDNPVDEITINGFQAVYFYDNHNYNNIVWDNGEYIFSLSSNISKEELILIAESINKIEE